MNTRLVLLALSMSLAACAAPTKDDTVEESSSLTSRADQSAFQKIVERKGDIFDAFCSDATTGGYAFTVRGIFQPHLYPQGEITQRPSPGAPSSGGSMSITPTDSPEFFAVRGTNTDVVFDLDADGALVGRGQVRGETGSWKCEVWAMRWDPGANEFTAWQRAL